MSRIRTRTAVALTACLGVVAGLACGDTGVDPSWVAKVRLDVDSLHLQAGETITLDAYLLDQNSVAFNEMLDKVHWGVSDSTLAVIERDGTVARLRAVGAGPVTVSAELGRGLTEIPLWIRPPGLATIEVSPNPVRVDALGSTRAEVRLLDAEGRRLDPQGFRIYWRPELERLVTLTPDSASMVSPPIAGRGLPGETVLIVTVNHLSLRVPIEVVTGG